MADLWTIERLLSWTPQYFKTHGVEEPRLDAELLLAHVLGKKRIYLYTNFDQIMNPEELSAYRELIKKRAAGWSVAALIGERDFMGLTLSVNEHVLIPRPDTETWLERIIQNYRNIPNIRMADLGTGSGAIAVAFLSYCKEAEGIAVDISEEALAVARGNGEAAGISSRIEWRKGDYIDALAEEETFDVILSNPPYIPTADMAQLAPEVLHEPHLALDGGADGLTFYRRLAEKAPAHLTAGGLLAAEVGIGQAEDVKQLFEASGKLEDIRFIRDYGGIDRAVLARRVKE